jgi:uncharacterized protein YgiM (DUF1202 family)
MAETYEEETRRILENRRRNAEIRRAQQIKRRNTFLMGIGGVLVVILLILVICISCSSGKNSDNEKESVVQPQTTAIEETTVVETTIEETTQTSMYTTDILNLRKEANTDSDIITQIDAGKKVEIISEEGSWCKIQRGKDTGYVMKKYLSYENTVD